MARRVIIACDICGNEPATTERFGLHGANYDVDLCVDHASELEKALSTFLEKAAKVEAPSRSIAPRSTRGGGTDKEKTKAIREWARANNIKHKDNPVSDRGRIPQDIIEKYSESH